MSIMCDNVEHLLCTYRLPVLTQMKTLTVYHVGDLFAAHPLLVVARQYTMASSIFISQKYSI